METQIQRNLRARIKGLWEAVTVLEGIAEQKDFELIQLKPAWNETKRHVEFVEKEIESILEKYRKARKNEVKNKDNECLQVCRKVW